MAKFKKVQQEATIVEESEMSVNQKRKADDKRTKAEEEAKAIKDAEEKKRLEREKREAEERARKQKEIFEGMFAAKEKNQAKPINQSNFSDIMTEQAVDSKKMKVQEEARFKKMNAKVDKGLMFNYLGAGQKAVSKETLAGTADAEVKKVGGKKKKKETI